MSALTPALLDLMDHEKVIEQGLATFVDVGCALIAIRDGKKYLAAEFTTFEDYLRVRWDMSRARGYQLIAAAETYEVVSTAVDSDNYPDYPLPSNEREIRELARLPLEERPAAWAAAVDLANDAVDTSTVALVVAERRKPQPVPKPTVAEGVPPHPATYPAAVLDLFRHLLDGQARTVLDPFAGVGTIHQLRPAFDTYAVELEPEWAHAHPDTIAGDSRNLVELFGRDRFDAIATSPAYGNRLADSYDAFDPEARRSYAIDLGRLLTTNNAAGMHFGRGGSYERLHADVWMACRDVLVDGGLLLLNCKDFVRDHQVVPVIGWHIGVLASFGFRAIDLRTLPAAGLAMTTATKLSEVVVVLEKAP